MVIGHAHLALAFAILFWAYQASVKLVDFSIFSKSWKGRMIVKYFHLLPLVVASLCLWWQNPKQCLDTRGHVQTSRAGSSVCGFGETTGAQSNSSLEQLWFWVVVLEVEMWYPGSNLRLMHAMHLLQIFELPPRLQLISYWPVRSRVLFTNNPFLICPNPMEQEKAARSAENLAWLIWSIPRRW